MGVSRVDFGTENVMDISGDTVTPDSLLAGATAHNSNGDPITGIARGIDSLIEGDGIKIQTNENGTRTISVSGLTYQETLNILNGEENHNGNT